MKSWRADAATVGYSPLQFVIKMKYLPVLLEINIPSLADHKDSYENRQLL